MLAEGSSPLARGLLYTLSMTFTAKRIIPARAGFTASCITKDPNTPDHPRSRGVYHFSISFSPWTMGSSPLARGLLVRYPFHRDVDGIIPARAGFTERNSINEFAPTDHPRSRGVYLREYQSNWLVPGSSPLARGLLGELGLVEAEIRIIPARAGFTWELR